MACSFWQRKEERRFLPGHFCRGFRAAHSVIEQMRTAQENMLAALEQARAHERMIAAEYLWRMVCELGTLIHEEERAMRENAHYLMPETLARAIPPFPAIEHTHDPLVYARFFTPDSYWSWYVTGYDPQERRCFGLVVGFEASLDSFSLDALRGVRGPLGLRVERDVSWQPKPLSDVWPKRNQ